MQLALDTNAYSTLQRGQSHDLSVYIAEAASLALPFIVIGELQAGFAHGDKALQNTTTLSNFIATPRVQLLYADDRTTTLYAQLWADLRRQGTPIPTNDIWIAALCIQHDYMLATNDVHFQQIALLQTVNFDRNF